jgi:hypothetical protein
MATKLGERRTAKAKAKYIFFLFLGFYLRSCGCGAGGWPSTQQTRRWWSSFFRMISD